VVEEEEEEEEDLVNGLREKEDVVVEEEEVGLAIITSEKTVTRKLENLGSLENSLQMQKKLSLNSFLQVSLLLRMLEPHKVPGRKRIVLPNSSKRQCNLRHHPLQLLSNQNCLFLLFQPLRPPLQ
jgi:hypothetical protein